MHGPGCWIYLSIIHHNALVLCLICLSSSSLLCCHDFTHAVSELPPLSQTHVLYLAPLRAHRSPMEKHPSALRAALRPFGPSALRPFDPPARPGPALRALGVRLAQAVQDPVAAAAPEAPLLSEPAPQICRGLGQTT